MVIYHHLIHHLQAKFNRSNAVFSTIDWYAHGSALRLTYNAKQNFVYKFIYRWLANNHHRFSRGDRIAACPSCSSCLFEDDFHPYYQCGGCSSWQQNLFHQLNHFHNHHHTHLASAIFYTEVSKDGFASDNSDSSPQISNIWKHDSYRNKLQ